MKRREFIKHGALAGAGLLWPASDLLASRTEAGRHRSVISALSVYSRRVLPIIEAGEVRFLASIDDMDSFLDAGRRREALPYADIRAEGNLLSFTHRGTRYRVENVLPEHYDARAQTFGSRVLPPTRHA